MQKGDLDYELQAGEVSTFHLSEPWFVELQSWDGEADPSGIHLSSKEFLIFVGYFL